MTIDDIERDITLQQGLLRQYEEQLSYATDPRKQQELNAEIRKTKIFILGLQAELAQLHEAAGTTPAVEPAEPPEPQQTTPAAASPQPLPEEPYITNYLNPYEPLPHHAQAVLKAMFANENEVTVHKRFGRGLSGSLVYIIRIGQRLPNVVKIDYYEKIMQEWDAFTTYIDEQMPSAILGRDRPVQPAGSDHAGLRYPLAGNGIFEVKGLYDFLRERPTAEGQTVLGRLFTTIRALYGNRQQKSFRLQATYDNALPQNLVIDCKDAPNWGRPFAPEHVRAVEFRPTDAVQVSAGWTVAEYLRKKEGVELRHPNPRFGFRMQLINVENYRSYQLGQPLGRTLHGTISDTRASIFAAALTQTVGGVDPNASTLPSFFGYPNPLYYLRDILNTSISGFSGTIHGDLNLENVIVESDIGNTHVIDFAKTRPDHLIRDFLHLEMNLVTTLLTEAISTDGYNSAKIKDFYERLHYAAAGHQISPPSGFEKIFELMLTIRQEAINALANRNDWREYEQAMFIYLLGSLRYEKVAKQPALHVLGKQTAFYAAATLLNILRENFDPQTLTTSTMITSTTTPINTTTSSATSNTNSQRTKGTSPSPAPPHPVTEMPLSRMREVIISTFSEEELRNFIFDLPDPEADAERFGRYKSEIARELIDFYRRRNMLPDLQQALFEARPNSDWWGKG